MNDQTTTGSQITQQYRAADRLAQTLDHIGCKAVFSLSGNQIMPLYDALIDTSTRIVHTRHEASAVFMADAYAQVRGEIGVALVTAAPGFGNALGALYTASMSEVPMILLSGDSPVDKDGQGAFQEFDQVAAASPFVKASLRLGFGDDIAEVFARLARIAREGTPGPTHLALPFDVLSAMVDKTPLPAVDAFDPQTEQASEEHLARILTELDAAQRPLILTGPHMFRTGYPPTREALSTALEVPIIHLDSPRGLRDPSKGALTTLVAAADCVFYLGKPVDFTSGFGADAFLPAQKIMMVSDNPATLAHAAEVFADRLIISARANASATADCLIDQAAKTDRRAARKAWLENAEAALQHRQLAHAPDNALASKNMIETIDAVLVDHPQAVVIYDGGEIGQWARAFSSSEVSIINGPSGAIGASLPYAIGAKMARPDVPVIAIMGDGTAGFHFAEFETAAREHQGITVIIGNDSRWNAEHHIQTRDYGADRLIGCELSTKAQYDIAARGLGCEGVMIENLSDLGPAISMALSSDRPTCLNVIIPGAPAPVYSEFKLDSEQ